MGVNSLMNVLWASADDCSHSGAQTTHIFITFWSDVIVTMMASAEVNVNAIFNLHLSSVLAIMATPTPRLSWRGLRTISYPGGSRSAMVQFDGFHISVKASTSRPLSIIRSLMSKALLQTERSFNYPMVIFAAASMEVNSAEEISLDLDLGCHILYLNKDFLTLGWVYESDAEILIQRRCT